MDVETKFKNLTDDLAFKATFSQVEHLNPLLNVVFKAIKNESETIVDVNPQKFIMAPFIDAKNYFGDLVATNASGTMYSIEMYKEFSKKEFKKSFSYACRLYSNQLKTGESYAKAKPVVSINFVQGSYLNKNKVFVKKIKFRDSDSQDFLENITMIIIYLDYAEGILYNSDEYELKRWTDFMKEEDLKKMEEKARGNKDMEQTLEFLKRYQQDQIANMQYNRDMDKIQEGILQTAINFLKIGTPMDTVIKATGLTKEELDDLAKEEA